jgi:GxxExxY protein
MLWPAPAAVASAETLNSCDATRNDLMIRIERYREFIYLRAAPQILDMVVDEKLVVEAKATERLHPNTTSQLFSYLCGTNMEVGLLLHFGREAKFHRVIYEKRLKHRRG